MIVEPFRRIDRLRIGAAWTDFEVQVWTGRMPRGADVTDVLTSNDTVSDSYVDAVSPHVHVRGGDGSAVDVMLDDDQPAPIAGELCHGDDTVCCGEDGCPIRRGKISAGVEGARSSDGIDAWPKVAGVNPGPFRQWEHDAGGFCYCVSW